MQLGKLMFQPIEPDDKLVSRTVSSDAFTYGIADKVFVAEIDSSLADTSAFCDEYDIGLDISTNCLVIEARRADKTWYAACLVLATDAVDVNGVIRKELGARKASFAPKDIALKLTGMEYGGITPIGLPADWPLYIDEGIMDKSTVVVGGGTRGSKVAVTTQALMNLPNAKVLNSKR